jgi:hypothetical protein
MCESANEKVRNEKKAKLKMKIEQIVLMWLFFPLFMMGQTDTVKGKYHYVICDESKPHAEQGHVLENFRNQIDTTLNFLSGKIVDFKNEGIPFATVKLFGNGKMLSCQTDLDGNYKFKFIPGGKYSMSVLSFGYKTFTVDSVVLTTGDIRITNIDLGDYACLKTKVIYTNVPMEEGDYKPAPIEKKEQ